MKTAPTSSWEFMIIDTSFLLYSGKSIDWISPKQHNDIPVIYSCFSLIDGHSFIEQLISYTTNIVFFQFIQKKDPMYKENKEETAWSMDRFNDYINKHVAPKKGLETDWVYNTLTVSRRRRDPSFSG